MAVEISEGISDDVEGDMTSVLRDSEAETDADADDVDTEEAEGEERLKMNSQKRTIFVFKNMTFLKKHHNFYLALLEFGVVFKVIGVGRSTVEESEFCWGLLQSF